MNLKLLLMYGVLLVMPFIQKNVSGQSAFSDDLYIRSSYGTGYVLPEYSLFTYLVEDYVRAGQVSLSKRSRGTTYWDQLYHYPEYGIALQYTTLGNREIFGNEISLYPFIGIPFLEGRRISLWNQLGLGIGVTGKKYDPESNPYNVAIGSYVNLHFNFELNAQYRLWQKLYACTGVSVNHFSNGNLGEPNLGINAMTFTAGFRYLVGKESDQKRFELEKHKMATKVSVLASIGSKRARSLQSNAYFISSVSLEYKLKLFRTFYAGIGADIFYDGSTPEEIRAFGTEPHAPIDNFKSGVHLSQELVFNRLSIAIQEGFYVGLPDKAFHNRTYHRFIIRHHIGDRWFVQLAMKAHVVVLDFLEFGAGYVIKP